MPSLEQEKLYNDIMQYYDYADKLIEVIEDNSDQIPLEHFEIVEDMVQTLEKLADSLGLQYIDLVKKEYDAKTLEKIRLAFNSIVAKIEECRNKILMFESK